MKKIVCLLLFWLFLGAAESSAQTDTTGGSEVVFTLRDFEQIVLTNHPIVKQAALLSEEAQAKVQQAWGSFDPALKSHFGRKTFGNTEYYNNWSNELKVPLWLAGADLKVGYDRFVGTYTNPETRTSNPGLAGIGLSLPIGQGFLIDSRRNTLRQAKVMVAYAEAEKVKQINQVWLEAVKDYWSWFYAYRQFVLVREGADLAYNRFEFVKKQTLIGDKPAIDSVEAAITFQERSLQLEKIKVELNNSRLLISNHLWNAREEPVELPDSASPQQTEPSVKDFYKKQLDDLLANASSRHPELLMLNSKGTQLQLERNYRREMLKPKLGLSASLITSRTDFGSYVPEYYDLRWNNYKLGVDFSFPLFLRAERGKLQETKVKQRSLRFDIQQTRREINTRVLSAYNTLLAYESQLAIQSRSIENQQVLLSGELAKFELGESTLFLINSRETKLIDMKVKLAELVSSYQKSIAELYYYAGTTANGEL
ncbi:TolC family protein [Dyadobacter psychrotolerans]|uniref:TolC family protein n=1 Tax=Dyadobacter psychrotolerans TaxID=2541721 RepID=A0A4R5DT07_9BACT|nr:TolC family protein [Dyadobacter psychrotolerans]TDE15231.1 TolC family protein [Dyadobacter psychrotolerans]